MDEVQNHAEVAWIPNVLTIIWFLTRSQGHLGDEFLAYFWLDSFQELKFCLR